MIMMNLQKAKDSVNQMDTVWIMMVKLVWNKRKIPQARENFSSWFLALSSRRYMWTVKGMYSSITKQSATAIPVRIRLMGLVLMSLWVRTRIFNMLKMVPRQQTTSARCP